MKTFQKFSLAAALAATVALTSQTQAQSLRIDNVNTDPYLSSTTRTYEQDGDLGFLFQVGSTPLLLTSLGQYVPSTGLVASDKVYLYLVTGTASGDNFAPTTETLAATATLATGALPDANGYAYQALTAPIPLVPGSDYVIDYDDSGDNPFHDNSVTATSSSSQLASEFDTQYITPLYTTLTGGASTGSTFPSLISTAYGFYVGPNATFSVAPEPSTWALLALGFMALIWVRRNRSRTV